MLFKAPLFSFEISLILKYKKVPPNMAALPMTLRKTGRSNSPSQTVLARSGA
jgi:hypothetical protein